MYTFTAARKYKFLWRLAPEAGKEGYGLAAATDEYAYVKSAPIIVSISDPDDNGIVKLTSGVGTLTLVGAGNNKAVIVPKNTSEEAWKQEFKLEYVNVQGKDGVVVQPRTVENGAWEPLRCDGYDDQWVVRYSRSNIDDEYWRPEPTEVSAKVTCPNGVLGINGTNAATVLLDDWWMCLKLKNDTGKVLTVKYKDELPQTVPIGQEFVVTPKATDRSVSLSVGDDLALVTLKMTKKGEI